MGISRRISELVRTSEPDVVYGYDSVSGSEEGGDRLPVEVRPSRCSVEEEKGFGRVARAWGKKIGGKFDLKKCLSVLLLFFLNLFSCLWFRIFYYYLFHLLLIFILLTIFINFTHIIFRFQLRYCLFFFYHNYLPSLTS